MSATEASPFSPRFAETRTIVLRDRRLERTERGEGSAYRLTVRATTVTLARDLTDGNRWTPSELREDETIWTSARFFRTSGDGDPVSEAATALAGSEVRPPSEGGTDETVHGRDGSEASRTRRDALLTPGQIEPGDRLHLEEAIWRANAMEASVAPSLVHGPERYLTENPFRVLGVGSGGGIAELNAAIAGVSRAARYGIGPAVAIDEATIVALAGDPATLTIFRLTAPVSPGDEDPASLERAGFALPLERFFASRSPEDLAPTLRHLAAVDPSRRSGIERAEATFGLIPGMETEPLSSPAGALWDGLIAQRTREAGVPHEEAAGVVARACADLLGQLVRRAASIAAESWTAGERGRAIAIVRALRSALLTAGEDEAAVAPFVGIANTAARTLEARRGAVETARRGDVLAMETETAELEMLIGLIGSRPEEIGWHTAVNGHRAAIARRLRVLCDAGFELTATSEARRSAIESIGHALRLVREPHLQNALARELAWLEGRERGERSPWDDVRPMKKAPNIQTDRGVGGMLYGFRPFVEGTDYEVTTLYFTFLYAPLFPITRYVVRREPDGVCYFGKLRWTKGMWIHLAVGLIVAVAGLAWLTFVWQPT